MWAWAAILLGGALIYMYIKNRNSAAAASTPASTAATDVGDESTQVPEFINQTYTTVNPPSPDDDDTPQPPIPPGPVKKPPTPTPTPVKPPAKKPTGTLAAPTDIHSTGVTSSTIKIAWGKVTGATSYRVRVTYQDKVVKTLTTKSTSATISGLGADHTYTIHVATVNGAGTGTETNGPAIKTSR